MPLLVLAAALATSAAALAVYEYYAGEHPFADAVYEQRLRRQDLIRLDRRAAANPRKSDVVVTLTTLPSRIPRIELTLKSLLQQRVSPAEIRLNVPKFSKREGVAYGIPAPWRALQCIRIVECDDFGPATKLIPALNDSAEDQRLLVVDDDRIYRPTFVEDMTARSDRFPDAAVAASGWNAPADLVDRPTTLMMTLRGLAPAPIKCTRVRGASEVDIMQGLSGYIIRPRFFDRRAIADYSGAPPAAFFVDDVWISAHCRAPKLVVGGRRTNFPSMRDARFFKRSSVALVNRGDGAPESRNNTIVLKHFADKWKAAQRGAQKA